MTKVLWFSLCPPYKELKHAGGQALYKHVISFLKHRGIEVKMVALCKKDEYQFVRDLGANFSIEQIPDEAGNLSIIDYESRWNPWNRFGGYLSNSRYFKLERCVKVLNQQGYSPDVIILNWTEMLALNTMLKKIYPEAKYIAIEEDVAFVKRKRRMQNSSNKVARLFHRLRYNTCLQKEHDWIEKMDRVAVYSDKDEERLKEIGISEDKIFVFSPVFADKSHLLWRKKNKDIIFWGAMSRKENSDSAIWFIRNVMPLLRGQDCRFVVVGANPPAELQNMATDDIIITGFVENPDRYFEESMCMVVPLVIGAGIKIKVLEGLSSGIPIVSNDIGTEGISVKDKIDYLHAETAEEFAEAIKQISNNFELAKSLSKSAKAMIKNNYNEEKSTEEFINLCEELANG